MTHTPEPWYQSEHGESGYPTVEHEGCYIAEAPEATEEDHVNMRRIVACVNACAGLSTERLEAFAEKENRLPTDGIALIDVYSDGDVILAVLPSPELDGLIDTWKELDDLYCETGKEGDWQPIEDWLETNRIQFLKTHWKTL